MLLHSFARDIVALIKPVTLGLYIEVLVLANYLSPMSLCFYELSIGLSFSDRRITRHLFVLIASLRNLLEFALKTAALKNRSTDPSRVLVFSISIFLSAMKHLRAYFKIASPRAPVSWKTP